MTNRKSTRRALLMSSISLLLCVSMLVGTTFAWFTDSVTSGVNQIVAGNLDVEVYYGDPADENSIKDVAKLFDDVNGKPILWEPGAVAYEKLTVANLGSLALKYQMSLNFTNEVKHNGKGLSDVLKVAVVDATALTDRDAALTAAKAAGGALLKDFTLSGKLDSDKNLLADAETSDTYGIVIYWEPGMNDNDFNMNNENQGKKLSIDLGIHLYATQQTAEEDSWDETYDENAWADGMKVFTAEDLQAAINNGENAVLQDDIETDEPIEIPEGTTIALNLAGHTLSGNIAKDTGAVLVNNGSLTVVGGNVASGATNGAAAIENNGTMTLKGVTVSGAPIADGGYPEYAVQTAGTLTIEEGTVISGDRGAISIDGDGATTINGGEFTANNINHNLTGHVVDLSDDVTGNHTLTINGGTFKHLDEQTSGGVVICNRTTNTVYVNGGNFSGGNYYGNDNLSDYGYGGTFSVKGGTFDAKPAASYIDAGYKAVDNGDGTFTVLTDMGTDLTAVAGHPGVYKSTGENYYVATADALMDVFANIIPQNTERAQSVSLMADIDLSGKIWEPLNNQHVTINGNNHTISNITCKEGSKSGLFGYAGGVAINDLTLENVTSKGSQAGIFAGLATGLKLNNCFVKGNNTVTYYKTAETWNGIGAITGVCTESVSTLNVTIAEGATVTLTKGDMVTESACVYNDLFGGYLLKHQGTVVNNGEIIVGVSSSADLAAAIADAATDSTTVIALNSGTYSEDITLDARYMEQKGDLIFKAAKDANPVITGKVTIGYYNSGTGAKKWDANVTFEGITFDQAAANTHSLNLQSVKSISLTGCTIIGDGEYGIESPRGNDIGASIIYDCTFENAAMQILGGFGSGLVIEECTFNNSCINVQAGNGVTIKGCEFNSTLTDAHNGDSFYVIRTSATGTPITVIGGEINVDSTASGIAAPKAGKAFAILHNRHGSKAWTITDVAITLTDAALAQTNLDVILTAGGAMNTTNVTVNGVQK